MAQVLQWNTQSLRRKKSELLLLLDQFNPIIVAISETWLVPGSRFRIPGYSCLRDDRDDGYAGSALLVKRSLPFNSIPLPMHGREFNAVALRVFSITFVSVYIPDPHPSILPSLYSTISSLPSPILCMGDFNGHHISWGSYYSDAFSIALLDIFDDLNVCLLNDGSPTRRVLPTQNPKSAVDLSFCSPSLSSSTSWSVLPNTYGSDHYPILMSISNRPSIATDSSPFPKYKVGKDKWDDFISSVENKLNLIPPNSENNFTENYNKF